MLASNRIRRRRSSMGVDGRHSSAPEEAVMDEQQLGPLGGGQLEQLGMAETPVATVLTCWAPGTCRPLTQ